MLTEHVGPHALASKDLYTDGAEVLWDFAQRAGTGTADVDTVKRLHVAEHYGEQRGQGLGDQDWIAETARREWIAFHKTDAIRRNEAEKVAVRRSGARCFCVPRAKRYLDILVAIAEAVVEPGPFIYSVYPDRIKLVPLD